LNAQRHRGHKVLVWRGKKREKKAANLPEIVGARLLQANIDGFDGLLAAAHQAAPAIGFTIARERRRASSAKRSRQNRRHPGINAFPVAASRQGLRHFVQRTELKNLALEFPQAVGCFHIKSSKHLWL
jgi:hypothetical protein